MVLSDFLKEIRDITIVARKTHSEQAAKREVPIEETEQSDQSQGNTTPVHSEEDSDVQYAEGSNTDFDDRDIGCQLPFRSFRDRLTFKHSVDTWTGRNNRLRRDRGNPHPSAGQRTYVGTILIGARC